MIDFVFSSFTKRLNSTKRPDGGDTISVEFKRGTSIKSPTLLLHRDLNNFKTYTYCRCDSRYYFIKDVRSVSANIIEVDCETDILATFKDTIGSYRCFIERSSQQDKLICDSMYVPREDWRRDDTIVGEPTGVFTNGYSGNFIVRTTCSEGVNLYYLTQSQIDALLSFMWSDGSWGDALSDSFTKLFFDPFKYILSIEWTPITLSQFLHIDDTVKLGFWDSGKSGNLIGGTYSPTVQFTYDLGIQNTRYEADDFRFYDPRYSRYYAKLPFVGIVPIDITKINSKQLTADYYYDAVSGLCEVWLRSGSIDLSHFQTQLSVPIQMGYASSNTNGQVSNVIGTASSAISGNMFGTIQNAISSARSSFAPDPSIVGSNASIGAILNNKDASQFTYTCGSVSPVKEGEGYADCNIRTISSLSGYIKCRNASVPLHGYDDEREIVNNYLNNGFYYD